MSKSKDQEVEELAKKVNAISPMLIGNSISHAIAKLVIYDENYHKALSMNDLSTALIPGVREPLEMAENKAGSIGRILAQNMPKGWGFVLLLATYGDGGITTYLSNCERQDIINLMQEMIIKFKSGEKEI